ncbi:hypothetical protein AAG906_023914 [Vitis piasezkii]
MNKDNVEYLYITSIISAEAYNGKTPAFSSGLYHTTIKPIESYVVVNRSHLWSSMMRRIIEHSHGHPLKNRRFFRPMNTHVACSQDASTRWSHVCLLSTRNVAFARLLAQIIRLRAQFPDYPIKTIRLDNVGEFTSQTFIDYCMSVGINIEHPVAHTHTQNGLAESFIKRHAIMHAAALVRIRPTTYHEYSPSQLVLGKQPNISHLRIFGCAVYVPIAPTQRTKMGPQRRLGIYVGFDSPSIIRYLEPLTVMFLHRFVDCHFNEKRREISWKTSTMTHLDPRTNQCELEVQRIIHLQNLKVTKSHIPCKYSKDGLMSSGCLTNESKIRLKRGRPVGSKDVTPRKRRTQEKLGTLEETIKMTDQFKIDKSIALEEAQIMQKPPKRHILNKKPLKIHILNKKPLKRHRYLKIRNENNEIIRYKARLVAQGFSQTGIDYEETYSPMYSIKLQRSLYGLKQSGRMWYNRLSEYLLKEGYVNNPICPCIFIKKSETGFAIIAVYVDDLNLVGTPEELTRTTNYLKKEFEMKDLRKQNFVSTADRAFSKWSFSTSINIH